MAGRLVLLRVALVGALCSTALALTLNVEHAVDAGEFVPCGRIIFDDSVLVGRGRLGTGPGKASTGPGPGLAGLAAGWARVVLVQAHPPPSLGHIDCSHAPCQCPSPHVAQIGQGGSGVFARTSTAPPKGAAGARHYALRVGADDADAVTASVPVGCLAASGGAAPLVLDLLGDGRLAAVAVACPAGGSAAGSLPGSLASEQAVEIRFPAKAADVQEVVPAAVAAEQKQRGARAGA